MPSSDQSVTPARPRQSSALVIGASSLGTIFEWYDFYLYGLLATIISAQFFSGVDETTGFIFALAAFATLKIMSEPSRPHGRSFARSSKCTISKHRNVRSSLRHCKARALLHFVCR